MSMMWRLVGVAFIWDPTDIRGNTVCTLKFTLKTQSIKLDWSNVETYSEITPSLRLNGFVSKRDKNLNGSYYNILYVFLSMTRFYCKVYLLLQRVSGTITKYIILGLDLFFFEQFLTGSVSSDFSKISAGETGYV